MAPARISPEMVARSRTVGEPRWSPSGRRLAWVDGHAGRSELLVAAPPSPGASWRPDVVAGASAEPGGPDAGTAPEAGPFTWAGDDALVFCAGRLVALDLRTGARHAFATDGRTDVPACPPDGSSVAFVVERDDACEIAVAPVDGSAAPVRVSGGADYAWDPVWSPDGSLVAWHEWDLTGMSWDASRIVVAGADGSGRRVVAGGDDVSVGQPRFAPDGSRLAYVSDEGGWSNVWTCLPDGSDRRPVLAEPHEHAEPAWGPGQRSFAWSPDGRRLAINRNEGGFGRLVVVDLLSGDAVSGDARPPAARSISKGWHHALDWGPHGIVAVRSGARTPPAIVVVDPDGSQERDVVARSAVPELDTSGLVEPETVSWTVDGATVHGLLYRAPRADRASGDTALPPMLVDVHGGPTGQATVSWRPLRALCNQSGWAVLAPNPRGSTGYGRAYAQALTGGWGATDVDDIAAGIRAAVENGWCDPARVAMIGASSGGLAVLMVCAQHPELVRAAVTMYAVTDLLDLAATTHRFESRYADRLVGELPGHEARYRERSPLTHPAAIHTPLLLLHGDSDEVVPVQQARDFADAVRAAGGTVELHVYEGERHGWAQPQTVVDAFERVERFLLEHVGDDR